MEVNTESEMGFSWTTLLINALPTRNIIGRGNFLVSQMRSQVQSILSTGRSKACFYDRQKEGATFEDLAGSEEVKTELREVIEIL